MEISGSVDLPMALPQRIEQFFGIVLNMAAGIEDPFEQSFFLMGHLPCLQAFEDANQRMSRLAAHLPLIRVKPRVRSRSSMCQGGPTSMPCRTISIASPASC